MRKKRGKQTIPTLTPTCATICCARKKTQLEIRKVTSERQDMAENLAANLCLLLEENSSQAIQWKLLGQERDCSLLLGWVEEVPSVTGGTDESYSVIGRYDRIKDKLQVLYKFKTVLNLVQATINQNHSLLGYVTKKHISTNQTVPNAEFQHCDEQAESNKEKSEETNQSVKPQTEVYEAHIIELKTEESEIHVLERESYKQVRIQFLYKEKAVTTTDKLLVLVHQEYIKMYHILCETCENSFKAKELKPETLVKTFIWAQWDSTNQVLYHIHHRKVPTSVFTEEVNEEAPKASNPSPTLSGLQFHDDLPHETVINIPLNLPQVPSADDCGTYEDDVIPLRVHDCSLDLIVISDSKGMVCVCHHYLYQPVQPPQHILESALSDSNTVHFAYSITLLHHSCVIHCVVPGIPWARAKLIRPTFALYGEHHMIVFVQNFFTHLLEVGLHHEPCCHILGSPLPFVPSQSSYLVPLLNISSLRKGSMTETKSKYMFVSDLSGAPSSNPQIVTIDLPTLDLVTLTVPSSFLIDVFRKETSMEVRLGVLHYFLCHKNDLDVVGELLSVIIEKPRSLNIARIMQEFLISGSHSLVQKNLPQDAVSLLSLIPVTTMEECSSFEAKSNDLNVTLSHEKLWNTSVMLLSPQQRLVPYRSDLWTKLWDQLSKRCDEMPRFRPSHTAEKLLVSLACYQPEALSRCTTPMSPGGGFPVSTAALSDLMGSRHKYVDSNLPFLEMESCTASKQEHIVSVNLRELSVHLLKHGTQHSTSHSRSSCTPLHIHAMATRHVTAQLETSRLLCQMLCKAANVDSRMELERGFNLIDLLDEPRRWLLFTVLERYRYATEHIAFPVPQGFTSFFTYLGYRTLRYSMFLQYVQHSVFELQVDVAKIIMADIGDTKENVCKKLELLSLLPRTRAKRLLNQWLHPMSFMLRAREHASNILSGELSQSRNRPPQHRHHHNGLSVFSTSERLSPLDTFLDLLTAKASLTELDFGLLIEATVTSLEDFF